MPAPDVDSFSMDAPKNIQSVHRVSFCISSRGRGSPSSARGRGGIASLSHLHLKRQHSEASSAVGHQWETILPRPGTQPKIIERVERKIAPKEEAVDPSFVYLWNEKTGKKIKVYGGMKTALTFVDRFPEYALYANKERVAVSSSDKALEGLESHPECNKKAVRLHVDASDNEEDLLELTRVDSDTEDEEEEEALQELIREHERIFIDQNSDRKETRVNFSLRANGKVCGQKRKQAPGQGAAGNDICLEQTKNRNVEGTDPAPSKDSDSTTVTAPRGYRKRTSEELVAKSASARDWKNAVGRSMGQAIRSRLDEGDCRDEIGFGHSAQSESEAPVACGLLKSSLENLQEEDEIDSEYLIIASTFDTNGFKAEAVGDSASAEQSQGSAMNKDSKSIEILESFRLQASSSSQAAASAIQKAGPQSQEAVVAGTKTVNREGTGTGAKQVDFKETKYRQAKSLGQSTASAAQEKPQSGRKPTQCTLAELSKILFTAEVEAALKDDEELKLRPSVQAASAAILFQNRKRHVLETLEELHGNGLISKRGLARYKRELEEGDRRFYLGVVAAADLYRVCGDGEDFLHSLNTLLS